MAATVEFGLIAQWEGYLHQAQDKDEWKETLIVKVERVSFPIH